MDTPLTQFLDPDADCSEHPSLARPIERSKRSTPRRNNETGCMQLAPARYVTVALASILTGLSEKAIRKKIEDGKWIADREYRRSPDNRIFIDLRSYERWVERAAV